MCNFKSERVSHHRFIKRICKQNPAFCLAHTEKVLLFVKFYSVRLLLGILQRRITAIAYSADCIVKKILRGSIVNTDFTADIVCLVDNRCAVVRINGYHRKIIPCIGRPGFRRAVCKHTGRKRGQAGQQN